MAESNKYTFDEWVGQVRPDPRNTDQLTLLQGYIGQSSESGHIRVYSDETLNNFVEVPEDAIIYAQRLSQTESSLGGSKLWLRSDVVITYGDPKLANRPKSTFLEGDLMQQYTTQYGGYGSTGGTGAFGGQPAGQGGQFIRTTVTEGANCTTQLLPICTRTQGGQFIRTTVTEGANCTTQLLPICTRTQGGQFIPTTVTGGLNCITQPIHCLPQIPNTAAYTYMVVITVRLIPT